VRKDYVVRTIPLTPWEFVLLDAMAGGGSFTDGVRGLTATHPPSAYQDPAFCVAVRQARDPWINWGLFIPRP